jgi:hypothetical protein
MLNDNGAVETNIPSIFDYYTKIVFGRKLDCSLNICRGSGIDTDWRDASLFTWEAKGSI